jgi:hypothetical protein
MSDTFRKVYRPLQAVNADLITEIKVKAEELEQLICKVQNREIALAKTNLEQAIMWATKGIVLRDELEQLSKEGKDVEL